MLRPTLASVVRTLGPLAVAASLATGCAADDVASQEDDLTSKSAKFLELGFQGSVVAKAGGSEAQQRKAVVTQLFYLSGELDKTHGGHGQFGYVELDNVQVEDLGDGTERISYSAKVPVAWPKWRDNPDTYRVVMPASVVDDALRTFNNKYIGACGKGKYGADSLWYDFEPVDTACEMDAADIVDTEATLTPSTKVTQDRLPEYDRMWEDDTLKVVVVHGSDSSHGLDESDVGVAQYLNFHGRMERDYPGATITKGETTHNIWDDWTLETTIPMPDGGQGKLVITTLLTSSLKYIGNDFDERYGALSTDADIIMYGGHSGLSKNITALADKTTVVAGQYQVLFIDGCSTYAYLDNTLAMRKSEANGADVDPMGTRDLDLVVNAQPAPWYSGAGNLQAVIQHMSSTTPLTYEALLDDLSQSGMPLVAGEEDNPVAE